MWRDLNPLWLQVRKFCPFPGLPGTVCPHSPLKERSGALWDRWVSFGYTQTWLFHHASHLRHIAQQDHVPTSASPCRDLIHKVEQRTERKCLVSFRLSKNKSVSLETGVCGEIFHLWQNKSRSVIFLLKLLTSVYPPGVRPEGVWRLSQEIYQKRYFWLLGDLFVLSQRH